MRSSASHPRRDLFAVVALLASAAGVWLLVRDSGSESQGAAGPTTHALRDAGGAAAESRPATEYEARARRDPVAAPEPVANEPPRDARVAGNVTDEDGHKVAGARVWLAAGRDSVDFDRDLCVTSDAAGRFTAAVPSGRVHHHAEARGFGSSESLHDVVPGDQDHEWLIVLWRGSTLHGTVLDAEGRPLAGARVAPGHAARGARMAVTTAADGTFLLEHLGRYADVRVDAKGHQPGLVSSFDTSGEPLVVRLEKALTLAGTVRGPWAGSALVHLDWEWRPPDWARERSEPRPVAADGSFAFEGLPPGEFTVRAQAGDRARSRTAEVSLPQTRRADLELEASAEHAISVVDETGRPVAGAEVALCDTDQPPVRDPAEAAWVFEQALSKATSDPDGKAMLRGPAWRFLALAVRGNDCASVFDVIGADCAPAERTRSVRTKRQGRVAGTLADEALLARATVCLWLVPEGGDPDRVPCTACVADTHGEILSPPVAPGAYDLLLELRNKRGSREDRRPGDEPVLVPLDFREWPRVASCRIVAGEVTRLATPLVLPTVGSLEGIVLAAGRGVPGVRVFAVEPGAARTQRERAELLGPRAYMMHPHALTDAQGKFRFVDPVGRACELFARARESDATLGPLAVAAAAPGATRTVTIRLAEGAVTGTFALAGIPARDRQSIEAYLFPIAMAEHDVIYWPYEGTPLTSGRHIQHVGMSGRFAFPFLAPGRYVVRIVGRFERLVCQRVCDVGASATVDLGRLEPATGLTARVPCQVTDAIGAWIRAPDPGNARGVWVATARVEAGALALEQLAPGRYLVELFARNGWRAVNFTISGSSLGRTVDLELRADGTTWPAEIR